MRRRFASALLLVVAVLMTSATAARADTFSGSSVALSGMYDAYAPSIITSGHRWDMWFGGWLTSAALPNDKVYHSVSYDSGHTWSSPALAFQIDGIAVNDPSVLRLRNPQGGYRYLMYFTYSNYNTPDQKNLTGLATSNDATTWTNQGLVIGYDNLLDNNGAWAPSAVAADPTGSTIYLYYFPDARPAPNDGAVYRSTMTDGGRTLSKTIEVVPPDGHPRLNVDVSIDPRGGYWMFYDSSVPTASGASNFDIEKMYSADGAHWTSSAYNPLVTSDTNALTTPYVVWTGPKTYSLFYGYGDSLSFTSFHWIYREDYTVQPESAAGTTPAASLVTLAQPPAVSVLRGDKALIRVSVTGHGQALSGSLAAELPPGWRASPSRVPFSLASGSADATQTFAFYVTPPESASAADATRLDFVAHAGRLSAQSASSVQVTGTRLPTSDTFHTPRLDLAWQIVRSAPGGWSLTDRPGSLRLSTLPTSATGVAPDLFVRTNSSQVADFTTSTTSTVAVDASAMKTANQQVALLAYRSDDDNAQVRLRQTDDGLVAELVRLEGGVTTVISSDPVTTPRLELRMVQVGDDLEGEWSADDSTWNTLGATSAPTASTIALQASSGVAGPSSPVYVDDLSVISSDLAGNLPLLQDQFNTPTAPLAAGHTYGQSFIATGPFARVGAFIPTYASITSGATLTLYRGSPDSSLTPIGSAVLTDIVNNSWNYVTTDVQPAGRYYLEMSDPVDTPAWWYQNGPLTNGVDLRGSAYADRVAQPGWTMTLELYGQ